MLHRLLITSASIALLAVSATSAWAAESPLPAEIQSSLDKQDFKKAIESLNPLADKGDANAQVVLATLYRFGAGVAKDPAKAISLYEKAAEKGDDVAQYNLGVMYFTGEGTKQDLQKAKDCFQKAAEKGSPLAQSNLAGLYLEGKGVEKDPKKAVEWATKAAKKGDALAQTNLGKLYKSGIGVEKSDTEATKWFRRAIRPRPLSDFQLPFGARVNWTEVQFPSDAQEEQLSQADAAVNKAKASIASKDFDGAIASLESATKTWQEVYGANDPWVAQGLGLKAQCLLAKNDFDKAATELKQALTILEGTKLVVPNKDIYVVVSLYGQTLLKLNKGEEAKALATKYQALLAAAAAASVQASGQAPAGQGAAPGTK